MTMHWDGVSWTKVSPPVPPDVKSASFHGVTMIAPDDVWAVGEYWIDRRLHALLEHWDGDTWTIVPAPKVGS